MASVLCDLEFVGGPFDGYKQIVALDPGSLMETATLPVSSATIRMMSGEALGPIVPARTFAIYKLNRDDRGEGAFPMSVFQYRFVRQRMRDDAADVKAASAPKK